jgi:hypothetical protein
MKKTKKEPSYTLSNFNLEKALEKKIKDKAALSEIEFNLCSEKQKRQYILDSKGRKLTKCENDWASKNGIDTHALLKASLLKSGNRLDEQELKLFSKEEIVEYIKNILENVNELFFYEKQFISNERYQQWLHSLVDKGRYLPDDEEDFGLLSDEYKRKYALKNKSEDDLLFEIFEWLDDADKLYYIAEYGFGNLEDHFENWFNKWKKAYEREQKMDSILK